MKPWVLLGFLLTSGAVAQPSSPFAPATPQASPPKLAAPTPLPTQAPQPGAAPAPPATSVLPPPRLSSGEGTTRVVLDLPPGASYTLSPTFSGLRIDLTGVQGGALSAAGATPQLSAWQYQPTATGVIVTLSTPFPLGLSDGWRSFELPADGSSGRRLVVDLNATLHGGAAQLPPGTVRPAPPTSPPAATVPALPPPVTPTGNAPLSPPRLGRSPGSTRVVLEFPQGTPYRVTPGALGLSVDLSGVSATRQGGQQLSPELSEWRFEPTSNGAVVTLRTPFALTSVSGWKSLLLPPLAPGGPARLAIDLSPAFADTDPLPLDQAALPAFTGPIRIVLDPGHGGNDPGAIASVTEKAVTLDVALRVRALLQRAGAQVSMTRTTDTQLSLDKNTDLNMRAAMGAAPNQVYVSIHVNAMDKASVLRGYGVETWWYPNNAGSGALAAALQGQMVRFTGAYSQGLKSRSLAVLRGAKIPAALVEIGYTTHPIDGQNLLSSNYLDRVAAGIAWGLRNYLQPTLSGGGNKASSNQVNSREVKGPGQ